MTLDHLRRSMMRLIREALDGYREDGEDVRVGRINEGDCFHFAALLMGMLHPTEEMVEVHEVREGGWLVHAWVEFDGWHFDAECVEGVMDPSDLPFFRRRGMRLKQESRLEFDDLKAMGRDPQVLGVRWIDLEATANG